MKEEKKAPVRKKQKKIVVDESPVALIAKKDWHLYCPPKVDVKIEKGKEIVGVPSEFLNTLKTEGVI